MKGTWTAAGAAALMFGVSGLLVGCDEADLPPADAPQTNQLEDDPAGPLPEEPASPEQEDPGQLDDFGEVEPPALPEDDIDDIDDVDDLGF